MISTLLVISALMISLIVAMMLGIQKSDLEDGDLLWINYLNMTSKPWVLTIDSGGIWHTTINPYIWDWSHGSFVSHDIAFKCIQTVGQLTTVIFVLMGTYFSLHTSKARDDARCFGRWMCLGMLLVVGSFVLFFAAFFQGTSAIGNAMGILYPAIRWHSSYTDLLEEVETGNHFEKRNFVVEPMAQSTLNNYAIAGIAIGLAGGSIANLLASWSSDPKDEEMSSFLHSLSLDELDVDEYLLTFSRERLSLGQIKHLSLEQLAWIGIPCGDALKMLQGRETISTVAPAELDTSSPVQENPGPSTGISLRRDTSAPTSDTSHWVSIERNHKIEARPTYTTDISLSMSDDSPKSN